MLVDPIAVSAIAVANCTLAWVDWRKWRKHERDIESELRLIVISAAVFTIDAAVYRFVLGSRELSVLFAVGALLYVAMVPSFQRAADER